MLRLTTHLGFAMRRGVFLLFVLLCCPLFAYNNTALPPPRYPNNPDNNALLLRDLRTAIDALRHEVENHETELQMFTERVDNQEETVASLRQQVLDANQANKELVKGNASGFDSKLSAIEASNKGLIADLVQLKSHANDTSTTLTQYKQKLGELEQLIILQNQNIENLQSAVRSLTEAIQLKDSLPSTAESTGKTYRVQPGDSLEKIARKHNTTIQAIKDLNHLTSDRIIVGKTLQIP